MAILYFSRISHLPPPPWRSGKKAIQLSSSIFISQVLRVHDEEGQLVMFDERMEEQALETQRETELTQLFDMNKANKESDLPDKVLPTLRYVDMPREYTSQKTWVKRSTNRTSDTIGRVDSYTLRLETSSSSVPSSTLITARANPPTMT